MDADRLVFDFALVMVLLLVAPLLSVKLRLPDIAGLILAGVVVGEHGLGLFHLDQTFQLLGKVGLLYLMFLAGLEINLDDFQRYRKPGLVFGTLTFLIPQTLGTFGARWLLGFTWPQAILLASMFASHTLIPFPTVQRFGLGHNRAVTTAIGGTILTDTAALLVLAVVVQGHAGLQPAFWLRLALSLAALVVGAIYLLPRIGYWFFRRAAPDGAAEFIFVLAATFLVAYAAELAGVEPIIGAFLAGLALGPIVPGRGVLMSRIHFVGYALFIPFFLLSVGMRVDLRILFTGLDGWIVALFMVGTVTLAKWLAAWSAGRVLGYARDETGLLFGLSINQAAATLAAVLVGVRVGIFGDAVLNGTILMILVTCLLGPWITQRCARRLAASESLRPASPRQETGRVLVPLAAPQRVDAIMDLALMLRPDRCAEPIYPLHVASSGPDESARVAVAERLLGGAVARAAAANVSAIPLARLDSNVAGGILRAATEFRVGAILMGWQPQRRAISLMQGIPERVVTQSTQAVLIYHPGQPLATAKRLWVLAPPLIEHHPGLPDALRLVNRIAARAGTHVLLAATDTTRRSIETIAGMRPGAGAKEPPALATWTEVTTAVVRARAEGDALLLLSVRRGALAWQPSLERLPIEWTARWPEANLLIVFPPLVPANGDTESLAADPAPGEDDSGDMPRPLAVQVQSASFPAALRDVLSHVLPQDPAGQKTLAEELQSVGPVPLSPTIALMHVHTPLVNSARIAVGWHPAGIALDGFAQPPRELALLFSPRGGSPERHLRILAAMARAAQTGTLVASDPAAPA